MPNITINIYDGAGKRIQAEVALHFQQGMKALPSAFVRGGKVEVELNVDTTQSLAVVASLKKHHQFGRLLAAGSFPNEMHLMLVHKKELFKFEGDDQLWDRLKAKRPAYEGFLDRIPDGKVCSQRLMQNDPSSLACFLNILESIRWLPNGKDVIAAMQGMDLVPRGWWKGVQHDRIFIRATAALTAALEKPPFKPAGTGMHEKADKGFKETGRFSEANLNFSLKTKDNTPRELVLADVDLDYYEDLGAHFALEVIPHTVSKWTGKPQFTNPARIYAMRWMAIQNSPELEPPVDCDVGGKSFDPLFTISAG
jgi:hypothetical protein